MNKALEIVIVLAAVDKMNEVIDKAVGKANHTLHTMSEVGGKMAMGGTVLTEFFAETMIVAEKNEIANKRLARVFKNLGDANGEAARHAEEYSDKLALQIGVEHENIKIVQAKLAIFRSVSSEVGRMSGVFDRATKAAFDMAANGIGEAASDSVMLGKALEDPIHGLIGLRRVGIMFTEAEKNKLKVLTQTHHKLEAQKMIMNSIEKRVGGVAEATVTNAQKIHVAWEKVMETLGKGLLPILNGVLQKVMTYLPMVIKWIEDHQQLVKIIAATGIGLLAVGTALKILALGVGTVIKVFNALRVVFAFMAANPIILIITAIALAAFLIYKYWDNIVAFFKKLWEGIKAMFWKVVAWIKEWGILFIGPVGFIIKFWPQIVKVFEKVWAAVKGIFSSAAHSLYNAGKNIVLSIWEGIKSVMSKPIDAIKSIVKTIRDHLPFSPAKVGPLKDLHRIRIIETIADNMKPHAMVKAMRRTAAFTMAAAGSVGGVAAGTGGSSHTGGHTIHYNPVIHMSGSGSKEDFAAMLKKHERELVKVIDEANRKNKRTQYN